MRLTVVVMLVGDGGGVSAVLFVIYDPVDPVGKADERKIRIGRGGGEVCF